MMPHSGRRAPYLRRGAPVLVALIVLAEWLVPTIVASTGHDLFGGYASFVLDMAWTLLLVRSILDQLPNAEHDAGTVARFPWLLAMVVALAALLSDWALLRSLDDLSLPTVAAGRMALARAAISVALYLTVWTARAVNRPLRVFRAPYYRWVFGTSLLLLVVPPFIVFAKLSALTLVALASWAMWIRELSSLEERPKAHKWRIRAVTFSLGILATIVTHRLFEWSLARRNSSQIARAIELGSSGLAVASIGLVFVVSSVGIADGLAWAVRRSRSVRTRMLVVGFSCAFLAFALSSGRLDAALMVLFGRNIEGMRPVARPVVKLLLLGITVSAFSVTQSRGLLRSLEQSARAITEIRRGNLNVALDETGRDEVAAVARTFNQMTAMLQESEFLEKINADLRSRSNKLAGTLQALQTAQADLVRSERMASVATLVKGIAHELNNPINYIAGNMQPLRRYCDFLTRVATRLSDGRARNADEVRSLTHLTERKDLAFVSDDLARLTSDIAEGARRAQLIISDLQSLTSAAQRGVERIDLKRVVLQTISLLEPRMPAGVQIKAELEPVDTLPARAGQIEQVLINLTDNALHAVDNQGLIRICVSTADGQAVIRVIDDGPGMTEDVQRQALEPFFTTRSAGEGSGLGLAIVASIVRGHQGEITLKSSPGKGTEVEVRLPLEPDLLTKAELDRAALTSDAQRV